MPQAIDKTAYSAWFVALTGLFVACLIVSNIVAVKLIMPLGLVLPAAIVVFPLSYILGDVLTEVYGYRSARRVIWIGFAGNLVAVLGIVAAGALTPAPFWHGQAAFESILGQTPRILGASFAAYLVGEFANAFVLAKMKIATGGRFLWARTIGSTLVGQALDSAIFITLAFGGIMPGAALIEAVIVQWLAKSAYEALATPVTYAVVGFLKRREGIDVYDRETRFNPLAIAD